LIKLEERVVDVENEIMNPVSIMERPRGDILRCITTFPLSFW